MAKENQFVTDQQDRIIATLTLRIKSLEATEMDECVLLVDRYHVACPKKECCCK